MELTPPVVVDIIVVNCSTVVGMSVAEDRVVVEDSGDCSPVSLVVSTT